MLAAHAVAPAPGLRLNASAARIGDRLELAYVLEGDLDGLAWPGLAEPERADGLWRTTCFEAFVAAEGEAAYVEINLAPSRRWAAYGFSGYRAGMKPLAILPPLIEASRGARRARLAARLVLGQYLPLDRKWRAGLAAVVETRAGLSWWASTHPGARPDFHDAAGFVMSLGAA